MGINSPLSGLVTETWSLYEQLKQEWVEAHPGATPAEYEAAMREICEMLGI
jgi:hypothetical protein